MWHNFVVYCGTFTGIKSENNWCWRRQRRKEEWGMPASSSKVEFVQETSRKAECGMWLRYAAIFIKSWIYPRKWNVHEKLKLWISPKIWQIMWDDRCCHLHQKLNLFKKVKCYQKTETQIGSKNLQRVYIRWEMLASSLNVEFIQESEMLTKCWMWNSIYGECT